MFEESDKSTGQITKCAGTKGLVLSFNFEANTKWKNNTTGRFRSFAKPLALVLSVKTYLGLLIKALCTTLLRLLPKMLLLSSSMVFSVGPSNSSRTSNLHVVAIKLVAILVILCRSADRNNSNYVPLLIALYLYSAGARVDAITLLNHLGLSVSYDVLQKKSSRILPLPVNIGSDSKQGIDN